MNKRGFLSQILLVGALVFFLVIVVMITSNILDSFIDNRGGIAPVGSTGEAILEKGQDAMYSLDHAIIFVLITLFLAGVLAIMFSKNHPVFFVAGLLAIMLSIVFSVIFSNAYDNIVATDTFSAFETNYTIMPFIANNLPLIGLIMGILILVGVYARERFFT